MSEPHVHDKRFDGDSPYLVCECGERWDVLTGKQLWQRGPSEPMTAPEPRVMPRDVLRDLAEQWETAARRMGERALVGDPAAVMASVSSLERCAAELRAAGPDYVAARLMESAWGTRANLDMSEARVVANYLRSFGIAAVPSESEPELGGHRVDVGLPVWSEETRAVPSESDAGLRQTLASVTWAYHSEQGHPDPQNMCPEPRCQEAMRALARP